MYIEGQWIFLTLWEILLFQQSLGCRNIPDHNNVTGQETWNNVTEPAGGFRCCSNYQEVQGKCLECPPGTYGISCSSICPEGYYGRLCLHTCNCSIGFTCKPKDGCVVIADVSSSDTTKTENEPPHKKTVLDWFKITGFLAFGSLTTSGLIAFFVYLRKCCDRREQLSDSISALLRTLRPVERRSQFFKSKNYDAEHSIGAVGEAVEEEEKKVFETRKSVDEYFTVATSSQQRAPSTKSELSLSRKYSHISEEKEAPISEVLCNTLTVENDDIETEDYSILNQPLMIPPHQIETTIVDKEAFQTSKIPFSFHTFTPELPTWCGNLDCENNDNAAMDNPENDMDDSNGKRYPFNDTRKEVSLKQRSANNEGKADAIKNELVDICLALDPTNLDSHAHNMSLATSAVKSEVDSEGNESNEKLNHHCPSKRFKESLYATETKHQQVSANKQDFAKTGNMNKCPTNSIRIGTQYKNVNKETLFETNREAERQFKSGFFSFVAHEDIHHSQANTNAAELNNPRYQPSDTCRKAEEKNDAEQYIQNLQANQVAGEHTSFSNERPYSVVVKRNTVRMAIQHKESDPKINKELHSKKGKFEQPNTSDACGETPTMAANVLPDFVLGRHMNTDQKRREYSMAFNCTNYNDLRKVEAQSTIPSKEDMNDLKNCSTSSEKVTDTKISDVCHNETSFEDDLEGVYEDYANVKKPKSQPTRRLRKLKASVLSTIYRMKSKKKKNLRE